MLYLIGGLYACAFWIAGWKWPKIPLLLIFALAPFQNDISSGAPWAPKDEEVFTGGPHFSIAEINLLLTLPLFFLRGRPLLRGPTFIPVVLYLCACLGSAFLNWRLTTTVSLTQIGMYLMIAVLVFTSFTSDPRDFRPALCGLVFVGVILASAVIVTRSGYVLGLHKNGVGSSLAATVIVCAELWFGSTRRWPRIILGTAMALLVAGLFFSLSRGGWLGALCGVFLLLALRREFNTLLRLGLLLIPLIGICWALLPDQARDYATGFDKENLNIRMRYESMEFAQRQFAQSQLLGVGVGLRKEYDATNLFWLTLAETGVLGLVTFLYLHWSLARFVWVDHKRIAKSDPLFSLLALGGALVLSKFVHGMVDHYWSRGAIMAAWAAAGMATHAHFVLRQRMRPNRSSPTSPPEIPEIAAAIGQ